MWAITSKQYHLPVMDTGDDNTFSNWVIVKDGLKESVEKVDPFVYTLISIDGSERLSFVYDGKSVKPAIRTLKIYGAESLSPMIKKLATVYTVQQCMKLEQELSAKYVMPEH